MLPTIKGPVFLFFFFSFLLTSLWHGWKTENPTEGQGKFPCSLWYFFNFWPSCWPYVPIIIYQQTIVAVFRWLWLVFSPLPAFSELSLGLSTSCNCQWIFPWANAFYIPVLWDGVTSKSVSFYLICPLSLVIKGKITLSYFILLFHTRFRYRISAGCCGTKQLVGDPLW